MIYNLLNSTFCTTPGLGEVVTSFFPSTFSDWVLVLQRVLEGQVFKRLVILPQYVNSFKQSLHLAFTSLCFSKTSVNHTYNDSDCMHCKTKRYSGQYVYWESDLKPFIKKHTQVWPRAATNIQTKPSVSLFGVPIIKSKPWPSNLRLLPAMWLDLAQSLYMVMIGECW